MAFQCRLPQPWNYTMTRCINKVGDIPLKLVKSPKLNDLLGLIRTVPCCLEHTHRIRTDNSSVLHRPSLENKQITADDDHRLFRYPRSVIFLLLNKLKRPADRTGSIIVPIIFQLQYTAQALNRTQDSISNLWPWALSMEVVQASSLITTCIPYLKPFFKSLEVGALQTDSAQTRKAVTNYSLGYSSASRKGPSDNRREYRELRSKASGTDGRVAVIS